MPKEDDSTDEAGSQWPSSDANNKKALVSREASRKVSFMISSIFDATEALNEAACAAAPLVSSMSISKRARLRHSRTPRGDNPESEGLCCIDW